MITLYVALALFVALLLAGLLWHHWAWRDVVVERPEVVGGKPLRLARGRIVAAEGADDGVVYEQAATGQELTAVPFELAVGARRLTVEPAGADYEVRARPGRGRELRLGDRVEVLGIVAEERLLATRLLRAGWPRVSLLMACTVVVLFIAAVALVHRLTRDSGCPAGTQPHVRRFATGVEQSCRRSGTRDGPASITNHVGRVVERGSYRDGFKDGLWRRYYRDGGLAERAHYRRGERHGLWLRYHRGGALAGRAEMRRGRGIWHGRHENGKASEEGLYVGEKRDGLWTFWRSDGSLHSRGGFRLAKKHGPWTSYHEPGADNAPGADKALGGEKATSRPSTKNSPAKPQPAWRGAFAHGRRDGEWSYWRKEGSREKQGRFSDGKRAGAWRWWHENGKLAREGHFRGNKKHGVWTFFDDKGREQIRGAYQEGQRVGRWRWSCAHCPECDVCSGKAKDAVIEKDHGKALPAASASRPAASQAAASRPAASPPGGPQH